MTKSAYNSYLFYKFGSLKIVGILTKDILILANDNFIYNKEKVIKWQII